MLFPMNGSPPEMTLSCLVRIALAGALRLEFRSMQIALILTTMNNAARGIFTAYPSSLYLVLSLLLTCALLRCARALTSSVFGCCSNYAIVTYELRAIRLLFSFRITSNVLHINDLRKTGKLPSNTSYMASQFQRPRIQSHAAQGWHLKHRHLVLPSFLMKVAGIYMFFLTNGLRFSLTQSFLRTAVLTVTVAWVLFDTRLQSAAPFTIQCACSIRYSSRADCPVHSCMRVQNASAGRLLPSAAADSHCAGVVDRLGTAQRHGGDSPSRSLFSVPRVMLMLTRARCDAQDGYQLMSEFQTAFAILLLQSVSVALWDYIYLATGAYDPSSAPVDNILTIVFAFAAIYVTIIRSVCHLLAVRVVAHFLCSDRSKDPLSRNCQW
mgnify:CR=1 FL=1